MTATGFGRFLFVSTVTAFVVVGYGAYVAESLRQSAAKTIATGFVVLGVVPAPKPESNWKAKADKLQIMDSEAAGDIADFQESNFKTRFAALEK